ncbi:hypothetical protein ACHAPT_012206 [Fusarium lateritium]
MSFARLVRATRDAIFPFEREMSLKRPRLLEFRSSKTFIVATVALGIYTDVFISSSAIVTAPLEFGLWKSDAMGVMSWSMFTYGASNVWIVGSVLVFSTTSEGKRGSIMAFLYVSLKEIVFGSALGLVFMNGLMRFFLIETHVAQKWIETTPSIEMTGGPDPPRYEEFGGAPGTWVCIQTVLLSWKLLGALISMASAIPVYFGEEHGWSYQKVYLMRLAFYSPSFLSMWFGCLADLYGGKLPAISGFMCNIAFISGLAIIEMLTTNGPPPLVWGLMVLAGAALAVATTSVMSETARCLEDKQNCHPWLRYYSRGCGVAYGAFTVFFSVGYITASLASPVILERPNGVMP